MLLAPLVPIMATTLWPQNRFAGPHRLGGIPVPPLFEGPGYLGPTMLVTLFQGSCANPCTIDMGALPWSQPFPHPCLAGYNATQTPGERPRPLARWRSLESSVVITTNLQGFALGGAAAPAGQTSSPACHVFGSPTVVSSFLSVFW